MRLEKLIGHVAREVRLREDEHPVLGPGSIRLRIADDRRRHGVVRQPVRLILLGERALPAPTV